MAKLLLHERIIFSADEKTFVEFRVFEVSFSKEFPDCVKYSFVFVQHGKCVLRYDNEHRKGHHRHFGSDETKIDFISIEDLLKNFFIKIERIRAKEGVFNESERGSD
ncbi:MAG TPA: DUF6516 family protein [archaeon]|nr:DUF6516 family protein [archaeon]